MKILHPPLDENVAPSEQDRDWKQWVMEKQGGDVRQLDFENCKIERPSTCKRIFELTLI